MLKLVGLGAVVVVLALTASVGMRQLAGSDADGSGAIVMVSGRDDHGLLQQAELSLVSEPEGATVSGYIADGSFAEVLEVRGTWLRVRSIADPSFNGWIDDFYLRSQAALHNREQVTFVGAEPGPPVRVEVRLVEADDEPFWVAADHLTEIGADIKSHER